ncbi:hypothetical protein AX774_g1331 [Zancudomyces culisetae]|uniref:FCP1 homology domain-containing protein n=1 Tax=Zancudomyces culisetae TaxID=1213189 RepID=A0A1R1PCV1_ZANCU|nr:hypothetical protein AX774_g7851 [Zancudomyces culisetae]OMH85111.1 hypothetical protein AX774_g1331 [Zancudomyces culisetae]|eukprot:OMH78749.1 hypothetical protein AX774_g7851 [Zancudomyces culisetae]
MKPTEKATNSTSIPMEQPAKTSYFKKTKLRLKKLVLEYQSLLRKCALSCCISSSGTDGQDDTGNEAHMSHHAKFQGKKSALSDEVPLDARTSPAKKDSRLEKVNENEKPSSSQPHKEALASTFETEDSKLVEETSWSATIEPELGQQDNIENTVVNSTELEVKKLEGSWQHIEITEEMGERTDEKDQYFLDIDVGPSFKSEPDLFLQASPGEESQSDAELDSIADVFGATDATDSSDDDEELRSEITSPKGNVASMTSERLVTHVSQHYLLEPVISEHWGRKCLVLDLDETLLHSSFRPVENPDFIVPVMLEGQEHNVYVAKRPGVDTFLREMSKYYELVVFTASLSMYADPVLDLLDSARVVTHRLFRESCNLYNGNYVKDLSRLGRPLTSSIIIDNSPTSYAFHPENAIAITTWFNDPHDSELLDLIPFLIDLSTVDDVSCVLSLNHVHANYKPLPISSWVKSTEIH